MQHRYGTGAYYNVKFTDITVDHIRNYYFSTQSWLRFQTEDFDFGVGPVYDTLIKNITLRESGASASAILGLNSTGKYSGITFDNVKMPGKSTAAMSLADMNITNITNYEKVAILPTEKIEAEKFDTTLSSGVDTQTCTDTGGGLNACSLNPSDTLAYKNVYMTGKNSIDFRVASTKTATLRVRTGSTTGTVIGTLNITNTGGWQTWTTKNVPITATSGYQNLYFTFELADGTVVANLNYFVLKP